MTRYFETSLDEAMVATYHLRMACDRADLVEHIDRVESELKAIKSKIEAIKSTKGDSIPPV